MANLQDITNRSEVGAIKPWTKATAPDGYLLCDGSAVSRTTYADLFAVVGTTYGAGDSSTTFNVPDLQGKFPQGKSGTTNLATTGGANTVTITNGKYRLVSTDGTNWYDIFTLAGLGESWIEKSGNYTASDGDNIFVDTSGTAVTITLPASPSIGNQVKIIDSHGTSGTNNITVARNGSKIQGATSDLTISTNRAGIALVFYDSDNGWLLKYND